MENMVLLIEDEEKTGAKLKEALETQDINVEWAKDGKKSVDMMEKGKYDLIILDLKLPELSGEEALREIRKIDPYVEVIVYTNYEDPPVMQKLINIGIEGYIKKGPDADLWETVEEVKRRLDPFSASERDEVLASVPEGMFSDEENESE